LRAPATVEPVHRNGYGTAVLGKLAAVAITRNVGWPARKCLRGGCGCGMIDEMEPIRLERLGR
jgi:hypothetical protein